jgi:hypothetical protein
VLQVRLEEEVHAALEAHERARVRECGRHLAVRDPAHDPVRVVRAGEQSELAHGVEPPLR